MPTPPGGADVVVLGAGPAGVGAAYRLAAAGHRVVVLERGDHPGGAAASIEVGGMRVDHGSHRLHPSIAPAVLADLHRLVPGLQRRARRGRIRLAGRWIAFPLRPADLVRHLPPGLVARAAQDALTSPLRRPAADTYAEVLRAGLGAALCEAFWFPYARKLWGLDAGEVAGEQARRRVSAGSPRRLVARALRGATAGGGGWFWYPAGGFGAISEGLAAAAEAEGADVRYGSEVAAVDLSGPAVTTAGGEVVEAGLVLSTLPLAVLARLARPAPPPDVGAAAARLRTRAMVLVYLVVDRDQWTPYDAHYFPGLDAPVTRVSEPKNYRDGPDPDGRTVLCAELPCAVGDEVWTAPDARLGETVARSLVDQGLPDPDPVAVEVRRLPHAYPIYDLDWGEAFAAVDAWISAQPALVTFGRQGLFAHDNTHHALAMAWEAAAATGPGPVFDRASWAAARERFASHVVED